MNALDQRNNMLMQFVLNGLFFWELRQVMKIEAWKETMQPTCRIGLKPLEKWMLTVRWPVLRIIIPDMCSPKLHPNHFAWGPKHWVIH